MDLCLRRFPNKSKKNIISSHKTKKTPTKHITMSQSKTCPSVKAKHKAEKKARSYHPYKGAKGAKGAQAPAGRTAFPANVITTDDTAGLPAIPVTVITTRDKDIVWIATYPVPTKWIPLSMMRELRNQEWIQLTYSLEAEEVSEKEAARKVTSDRDLFVFHQAAVVAEHLLGIIGHKPLSQKCILQSMSVVITVTEDAWEQVTDCAPV